MNLLLYDYSPVEGTIPASSGPAVDCAQLCAELQSELDQGRIEIDVLFAGKGGGARKNRLRLFAPFNGRYCTQEYAGVLSYGGHSIQILSRFDRPGGQAAQKNYFLSYVLSRAMDIPVASFPELKTDSDSGELWDLLLAKLFLDQLREACSRGLYREYRTFHRNDASPKGAIDIAGQIRLNPMPNGRCAYSAREYTLNNPMNQLIVAARDCLLRDQGAVGRLVKNALAENTDLRVRLQQIACSMDAFHAPSNQTILHRTGRPITHTVYSGYEPLRRTARLIVQRRGLDTFQTGASRVSGMVFAIDKMWELFLEKAVFSQVKDCRLYAQSETKVLEHSHTIIPDFTVEKGGRRFLFDAKYKAGWGALYAGEKDWNSVRNDLYQVISYMHILQSRHGGFVFPVSKAGGGAADFRLHDSLPDTVHLFPVLIPQSGEHTSFGSYAAQFEKNCKGAAERMSRVVDSDI